MAYYIHFIFLVCQGFFECRFTKTDAHLFPSLQASVARVLASDAPSVETIKLQIVFHMDYSSEERKLIRKRLKKEDECEAALDQIVDLSRKLKNEQQVTNLYRNIFQFLLANGCIDAVTRTVEREVAAALESVFPKFGLKAFWYVPDVRALACVYGFVYSYTLVFRVYIAPAK